MTPHLEMNPPNLHPKLFGTRSAQGSAKRVTKSDGFYVYPDLHSLSPEYLGVCGTASDLLTEKITGEIDDEGVADRHAVIGDFNAGRTVSGVYMDPMTTPPVDNEVIRHDLGLVDGFKSQTDRRIWDDVFDCMFKSGRESVPLRMAKRSSSGFDAFTSDITYRKDLFLHIAANIDPILDLIDEGKLEEAFDEYNFVIAYYLGVRTQADTVLNKDGQLASKPREVNDPLYAMTAGQDGKRFMADKTVYVNDVPIRDFFAGRRRTVYGLASSVNMILAALFAGWRANYTKLYSFVWHHRGNDDVQRKVRGFSHFSGVDVKAFDTTVGRWMVDWFVNSFEDILDPRIVKLMRLSMAAPYYTTDPKIGGTDHFWMGDPFDLLSFCLCVGLPSGVAFNPDFGKCVMTATYLCVLNDYFGDVLEVGVHKILRGEHETYALLDMGDDCVLLTNSLGFIAYLKKIWERGESVSDYFYIEEESGVAFLGGVFYWDTTKDVHICPNVISLAVKTLWQEFPCSDPRRVNWAHGWFEKKAYYADAPATPEVVEILNHSFKKHTGQTLDALAMGWNQAHPELRPPALLSEADRAVWLNQDAIHYKVDVTEVSQHILDPLVHSVPAEYFEPLLEHLYQ